MSLRIGVATKIIVQLISKDSVERMPNVLQFFFSPRKADIRIGDSTEHCPIHYDSGLLTTFSEPKQNSIYPPREVMIM